MPAPRSVVSLDAADFHGIYQHPHQSKWHFLGELVAVHCNLKAVPEVDVKNLPRVSIQH
jgi:hypothetical protein